MDSEDIYFEIRPFTDDEVGKVLSRLFKDREFLDTFGKYKFGNVFRISPTLSSLIVRYAISRQFREVTNVAEMQVIIRNYMDKMIQSTMSDLNVSGLKKLPRDKPYLFISNHRDIAMDPAFLNYVLHRDARDTARIAIGDNLLSKSWVSDIMRLNKSFIVKRSLGGPRELLAAMRMLSKYINHSIVIDKSPVWLAQREGRAKDGVDKTEPAIIKMLDLCRNKKDQIFSEHISKLSIVPVAISYELDPCEDLKAKELYEIDRLGSYDKAVNEDVMSIGRGIAGQKGKVSISFGKPIASSLSDPIEVSQEIDRQIIEMYQLFPNNLVAHQIAYPNDKLPSHLFNALSVSEYDRRSFCQRIGKLPFNHQKFAYQIYANPVRSRLQHIKNLSIQ